MIELTPADLPDALASMDTAPGITDEERREILAEIVWVSRCELLDERSTFTLSEALAAMRAVASRTRPAAPEASAVTVERLRMAMIEAFFGVDCTNLASANRALDTAIAAITPTSTGGGT